MDLFGRLSDYEIFGHLTQGFLLLVGFDLVFGTSLILGATWDVPTGFAVVLFSYVVGHLVASPSSLILERGLVHRVLGAPLTYLLAYGSQPRAMRILFPGYFDALPDSILNKLSSLQNVTYDPPSRTKSEGAFWAIYPVVRGDDAARGRLATFLRLYAFCRNSAFVGLVTSVLLIASIPFYGSSLKTAPTFDRLSAAILIFVAAWILFHRFLKFYRLHSVELVSTYARLTSPPLAPKDKEPG